MIRRLRISLFMISIWIVSWSSISALAQGQVVTLRGLLRDFRELTPANTPAPGHHADFNNGQGGCADGGPARGAFEDKLGTADANPDNLPGFNPLPADERTPILKAQYKSGPNCFRNGFADWYTTRRDLNRAFFIDLPFQQSGNGILKYENRAFFPLDDSHRSSLTPQVSGVTQTFGHLQAQNSQHNYGFTFEFHAKFTYRKGKGQNFEFLGDDDVLVYINDRLVIDLGGIHGAEGQNIHLDNIAGLQDGQTYPLDFFFAERHVVASNLIITTSLELSNEGTITPPKPQPPPPADPTKVVQGWYFDDNGDGIADRAEIEMEKVTGTDPRRLELRLGGQTASGNWTITRKEEKIFEIKAVKGNFFSKPVTAWNREDPANRGRTLVDAAAGLGDATFPMEDRIGPIILKASKVVEDAALEDAPVTYILIEFSEPVKVGSDRVLKFRDARGGIVEVQMAGLLPIEPSDGFATNWRFNISPTSAVVPGQKFHVAIGDLNNVEDRKANKPHPENPWKPIELRLPSIRIGDLRAEASVTHAPVDLSVVRITNSFVLLESKDSDGNRPTYRPLHPETAEPWIANLPGADQNPGVVVFGFEISHPVIIEIVIYDHLGQFVNKGSAIITREDLLTSGKLVRNQETRGFVQRLAWYPVSKNGEMIATGAYILRSRFIYGIDARDGIAKGEMVKLVRFGFLRPNSIRGLGIP